VRCQMIPRILFVIASTSLDADADRGHVATMILLDFPLRRHPRKEILLTCCHQTRSLSLTLTLFSLTYSGCGTGKRFGPPPPPREYPSSRALLCNSNDNSSNNKNNHQPYPRYCKHPPRYCCWLAHSLVFSSPEKVTYSTRAPVK
jgi:hypothetical protein